MIVCLLVLAAVAPSAKLLTTLRQQGQLSTVEPVSQLPKYGQLTGPERPDPVRFGAAHYLTGREQTDLQKCLGKNIGQ